MKRIIISVLAALTVFMSMQCAAFAHPSSFSPDASGTVSNLITVKKPESSSTATMKSTYSITGVGSEGISVCIYIYDGENYVAQKNAEGGNAVTTLGASGVFYKQISLSEGLNRICVRAEAADGSYQLVYLSINMIRNEVMTDLGSFTTDMQSRYNGWLN